MYWAPTVCEHWRQSSEQKTHKALCSPCPHDSKLALQGPDIHPLQNSPPAANLHCLEKDSTNAQINMVPGAHHTEKSAWKFEKIKQMGTNIFWKIMQKIDVMSSKAKQSKTLRPWPWTCRQSFYERCLRFKIVRTGLLLWLNKSLRTHLFHLLDFFLGAQT